MLRSIVSGPEEAVHFGIGLKKSDDADESPVCDFDGAGGSDRDAPAERLMHSGARDRFVRQRAPAPAGPADASRPFPTVRSAGLPSLRPAGDGNSTGELIRRRSLHTGSGGFVSGAEKRSGIFSDRKNAGHAAKTGGLDMISAFLRAEYANGTVTRMRAKRRPAESAGRITAAPCWR